MVTCLLEISILNVIDLVPSATMFPAHGVLMVSVTFTAATVTAAIRTGVIGAGVTGTGVIGTGVIGAGVIGAGVIGAGVVGAGVIGAGVVGAGAIVVGAGSGVVMVVVMIFIVIVIFFFILIVAVIAFSDVLGVSLTIGCDSWLWWEVGDSCGSGSHGWCNGNATCFQFLFSPGGKTLALNNTKVETGTHLVRCAGGTAAASSSALIAEVFLKFSQ